MTLEVCGAVQARHNVTVRWDVALNQRRIARFVFPRDDSALRIVLGAHLLPAFDIFILLRTGICSQARARFLRTLREAQQIPWVNRMPGKLLKFGCTASSESFGVHARQRASHHQSAIAVLTVLSLIACASALTWQPPHTHADHLKLHAPVRSRGKLSTHTFIFLLNIMPYTCFMGVWLAQFYHAC